MIRLFALVLPFDGARRSRHFSGLPPVVTGGRDHREELPTPGVLVVEGTPDGYMLYRYAMNGCFAGDTWHPDLDQAKQQAISEYADALGEWKAIPESVEDPVAFALTHVS